MANKKDTHSKPQMERWIESNPFLLFSSSLSFFLLYGWIRNLPYKCFEPWNENKWCFKSEYSYSFHRLLSFQSHYYMQRGGSCLIFNTLERRDLFQRRKSTLPLEGKRLNWISLKKISPWSVCPDQSFRRGQWKVKYLQATSLEDKTQLEKVHNYYRGLYVIDYTTLHYLKGTVYPKWN